MVCGFPTTLDSKDSPLHFSDGTASTCCCAFSVMPLACKHAYLKLVYSSVAPRSSVRSRNGGHKRDSKCRAHSSWATTQLKYNSRVFIGSVLRRCWWEARVDRLAEREDSLHRRIELAKLVLLFR